MTSSRRPNFFIVGAPKCGTTALSEYLREHPSIFMSTPKEPHYFAADFNPYVRHYVHTLDEYLALFEACKEHHLAAGEASVFYLYSSTALSNIRAFDPDARIIAMVRNPIDMAYSLHSQYCYNLRETVRDFRRAWELQAVRREGKAIPSTSPVPAYLLYEDVCSLGSQVERLLQLFRREQVKIVVFDDFAERTKAAYEDVLAFLGVPSDGRERFPRLNPNTQLSSRWIKWLELQVTNLARFRPLNNIVLATKRTLGLKRKRIFGISPERYTRYVERPPLDPAFRAELANTFRPEIDRLSRALDRDLSHWLE
ncbi:MAG: sulfotransferase [Gemmatimonadota bacterium]|nr:MAG: sulfotransferase [Gemmatimonadota bacterium]